MKKHAKEDKLNQTLDRLNEFSRLCELLSNEKRARIVLETVNQERSVGEIAELIGLSQSATSQHLKRLRSASVMKFRRDKQNTYYTVSSDALKRLLTYI